MRELLAAALIGGGLLLQPDLMSFDDILALPVPDSGTRIAYGDDLLQFGELRLPDGNEPHPVVVVVHGGCWRARYRVNHIGSFSDALTRAGVATWSIEYRAVGDPGGGWPGTFLDAGAAVDHLRILAEEHPLDLTRVVAVGHSAGGQLVLWLAARTKLEASSPIRGPDPLPLSGVVSLAGVDDLRRANEEEVCGDQAEKLLGGPFDGVPERYQQASPIELVPLGVPQHLINGSADPVVPVAFGRDYTRGATAVGDAVELTVVEGAGHFELIAPTSAAWSTVRNAVLSFVNR